MVKIMLNLDDEENHLVEIFKAINKCEDKKVAIRKMIRQAAENLPEFKSVDESPIEIQKKEEKE